MAKHFVTLGHGHNHKINGLYLNENTVVVYEASSYKEGREQAWDYFGGQFFTDYHGEQWKEDNIRFFPSGYVNIKTGEHVCNENAQLILLSNNCRYLATQLNKIQYEDKIVGSSVCCSICMKAAIDSRDIHNI